MNNQVETNLCLEKARNYILICADELEELGDKDAELLRSICESGLLTEFSNIANTLNEMNPKNKPIRLTRISTSINGPEQDVFILGSPTPIRRKMYPIEHEFTIEMTGYNLEIH